LQLPLATDEVGGWKPHPIFEGPTQTLKLMESHASSLTQGSTPHPPHAHPEEELLLLLSGKVDLDLPRAETGVVRRLTPGDFVYYPADFPHTLTTVTAEPANYLMFKWRGHDAFHRERLPFGQYRAFDRTQAVPEGFHPKVLFEGPTAYLQRLHCHASTLTPGAGYEAHADPYDVVIVVLEGEIATLGGRVGPFGVVYCPEGVEHGMSNPGSIPAKYLVFEFEGRGPQSLLTVRAGSLAAKLASAEVWKGKLRYEWTRLRQKLSRSGE
jgi:quercetin dioxygenase-like cupin family protein